MIHLNPLKEVHDFAQIHWPHRIRLEGPQMEAYVAVLPSLHLPPSLPEDVAGIEIASLDLTVRTTHALAERKITTIGALVALTDERLRKMRGIGRKGLDELRDFFMFSMPGLPRATDCKGTEGVCPLFRYPREIWVDGALKRLLVDPPPATSILFAGDPARQLIQALAPALLSA